MLNVNPETIFYVIDKGQEFHVKEEVTFPEDPLSPSDDWAQQILADHAGDPVVQELTSTINDLEPDQQVELVALMWLGRGDYTIEEWEDALEVARDSWNGRTAEYLIGTPMLSDYLSEGLELHGYARD